LLPFNNIEFFYWNPMFPSAVFLRTSQAKRRGTPFMCRKHGLATMRGLLTTDAPAMKHKTTGSRDNKANCIIGMKLKAMRRQQDAAIRTCDVAGTGEWHPRTWTHRYRSTTSRKPVTCASLTQSSHVAWLYLFSDLQHQRHPSSTPPCHSTCSRNLFRTPFQTGPR